MKYSKGETISEILTTLAGLIFTAYFFLPDSTINNFFDFFNNTTSTEQVIEYEGQK